MATTTTDYFDSDLRDGTCKSCDEQTRIMPGDGRCPDCIEEEKFYEMTMQGLGGPVHEVDWAADRTAPENLSF